MFFLNFAPLTKQATLFYHWNGYLLDGVAVKPLLSNDIIASNARHKLQYNNADRYMDSTLQTSLINSVFLAFHKYNKIRNYDAFLFFLFKNIKTELIF